MRYFSSSVPSIDDSMGNQTDLSDISDDEFKSQVTELRFKWYHRVFQVICFFVFLGPIRLVVGFAVWFFFTTLMFILRYTQERLGCRVETGRTLGLWLWWIGVRFLFLIGGNIWIVRNGRFDPRARFVVANHNTAIDGFVLATVGNYRGTGKYEYRRIALMRILFDLSQTITVNRSEPSGASAKFEAAADDLSNPLPLGVFAEATMTNGDILLRFHTGAFLTNHPVQPVAIRYWQPFVPKGWNSWAYLTHYPLRYVWCLLSMPLNIITCDVLPMVTKAPGETPHDFAKRTQLIVANHLKVKAVTRSSHDLFRGKGPQNN
jgi:1-acyl-sn-glycerol-3-phosphate acyltransferase